MIEALPSELILEIAGFLCATDRWALMRTCRRLHAAAEPSLWRRGPKSSRAAKYLSSKYKFFERTSDLERHLDTSHAGALMWALDNKQPEIARRALQFKAAAKALVAELVPSAVKYRQGCATILELFLDYLPHRKQTIDSWADRSLLIDAGLFSTVAVFKTLLRHGADPNVQWNRVPLLYMLLNEGGKKRAELLLEYGAKLMGMVKGERPLSYAIKADKAYILPFLAAEGVDVYATGPNSTMGQTLCDAVRFNSRHCVEALLEGSSEAVVQGCSGNGVICMAYANDERRSIWEMLLDKNVPINIRCKDGQTMLMLAAGNLAPQLTRMLLERGADATLQDDCGKTAVDYACEEEYSYFTHPLDLASDIIVAGCRQKRGSGDEQWCAPWRMALSTGRWNLILRVLEREGYDPCARDLRGQTFLMHAAKMRAGKKVRGYDFADNRKSWYPRRRDALPMKDDEGNTALFWAVLMEDVYLCKRLLRAGADANVSAGDGRSLLSVAAAGSAPAIMRRLLRHVDDVNARDGRGRTALSYAACNTAKEVMRKMVRMLMAAAAKPSRRLRDDEGLRPAGRARQCGQEDEFRDAVLTWRLSLTGHGSVKRR